MMNLKFPHALLMWVRENKARIKIAVPPPGMPAGWGAQLEDLKLRLVHFERDFRGAQAWIANNCASSGWFVSSNLPVRAASAALLCAEHALLLLPYLSGTLWSDFNNFLSMPAPSAKGCASYTLLKEGTFKVLMKDAPEVRLDWGYEHLGFFAGHWPNTVQRTLPLPVFTPRDRTVREEIEHIKRTRQFVRERLEHLLPVVVENARRSLEWRTRKLEEVQQERAQQEQTQHLAEEARVGQLARGFHAVLSEADRELLRKHVDLFRNVFEAMN